MAESIPDDAEGPSEPVTTISMSIDELIEHNKREQEEAFQARKLKATEEFGTLVEYRECMIANKPYVWIKTVSMPLQLFQLTLEGHAPLGTFRAA